MPVSLPFLLDEGEKIAPPKWLAIVLPMLCIASIALPPGIPRISGGAVIVGAAAYHVLCTREEFFGAYVAATASAGLVLRWVDLCLLHRPERDFWKVGSGEDGKEIGERAPESLVGRLLWFGDLWTAQRGVGWNIQTASTPPSLPEDYPRSKFLRDAIFKLVKTYITIDILQTTIRIYHPSTPFFSLSLPHQIILAWLHVFHSYRTIFLPYLLASMAAITLNIHSPSQWPPLYWSFRTHGFTIRKIWGKCWHQMMRRPCATYGILLRDKLGMRKGSFGSRYLQVWVGFAVSALLHQAGAMVGCFAEGGKWQGIYFMVQPVGIMIEDAAIHIGKSAGIQDSAWVRRLGFLWVFLWFSWTMRFMLAFQPYGWLVDAEVPSLVGPVLKALGWDWRGDRID